MVLEDYDDDGNDEYGGGRSTMTKATGTGTM